jgi:uncharacterized protein YozE (UPF0346 family)
VAFEPSFFAKIYPVFEKIREFLENLANFWLNFGNFQKKIQKFSLRQMPILWAFACV